MFHCYLGINLSSFNMILDFTATILIFKQLSCVSWNRLGCHWIGERDVDAVFTLKNEIETYSCCQRGYYYVLQFNGTNDLNQFQKKNRTLPLYSKIIAIQFHDFVQNFVDQKHLRTSFEYLILRNDRCYGLHKTFSYDNNSIWLLDMWIGKITFFQPINWYELSDESPIHSKS